MSWAKKFSIGSPRNDFRDSGQGAVPSQKMASLRKENHRPLLQGGSNLNIKVGQTGLSKAAGVDHFFAVRVDHFLSVANSPCPRSAAIPI